MRKFILTLTALGFLYAPAYAKTPTETITQDIIVKVNGLVCDFCARALEKVFSKREEVNGIHVDLDTHQVSIDLKEGSDIPDEDIKNMINDSGYNVREIIRD